jgi:hypothetical protein
MAHYAFLNQTNIVTEVITGIDETELIEGLEPEVWYGNFRNQKCVRTSYNAKDSGFRKNFAGIGFTYDEERDAFIPPKPFQTWILNEDTCQWEAPVPSPAITEDPVDPDNMWVWADGLTKWIKVPITN